MNDVLIYLQFSTLEPKEKIKTFITELKETLDIEKISSVFKRKNKLHSRLDDVQEFVIKGQTSLEAIELNKKITIRAQVIQTTHKIELLTFAEEVRITPQLTLPHPSLYLDPLILHCSAEIWPDYIHPINGSSLRSSDHETNVDNLEFLFQGKFFLE